LTVNQDVVIDPVKELLQINVHDHSATGLHVRLRGKYRVMRTPSGTKAVAMYYDLC
jgi:hypothetical protein